MSGCLNRCYLYWETHSLEPLDSETQIKVEKELEKARLGRSFDESMLSKVVNRRCLGGFLNKEEDLKDKCWHYWELPQELTLKERMEILNVKQGKKWKIATFLFGLLNVILLVVSLNLSLRQPQLSNLETQNTSLKSQITTLQNDLNNKQNSFIMLQSEIGTIKSQNNQMNQKVVTLEAQLTKCEQELSSKTRRDKNIRN